MRIEPSIYLDALMNDFLMWGGKVVIRKFDTPRDVATLSENVIVNCTGLGSKALFSDAELVPLKGQLDRAGSAAGDHVRNDRRRARSFRRTPASFT